MSIAYFYTWTTYGTWLPGDPRGWFQRGIGIQDPDPCREEIARFHMSNNAVILGVDQRTLVEETIANHCTIRKWTLHGVNCRTNHVHVVVSAENQKINVPREQFKSWCTRRLKERAVETQIESGRTVWWTERGWDEFVDNDVDLARVMEYVLERQD